MCQSTSICSLLVFIMQTYSVIIFCSITNFLLVCFTRFNKHNQLDIVTNANEIKTESGPNEYANTDW